MKIIIDCGSTKADWALIKSADDISLFSTSGFNPNYTERTVIHDIISKQTLIDINHSEKYEIIFYGSGCAIQSNIDLVNEIISSVFVNSEVTVTDDMLAACHATLQDREGVACILGTGSNSCYYDGENIIESATSLGFILGDEGSASYIGKRLIHDYFYKTMPSDLSEKLKNEYDINISKIIDNVYHKNEVSKFLATYSRFAFDNKEDKYIRNLCSACFNEYIKYFILRYKEKSGLNIGFVGSIAYYFQDILKECLDIHGLKLGEIVKKPIDNLIKYHLNH